MSELLWHLDVWRSGTFLLYSGKAAFWIQEMSPRLPDVQRSVVLWSMFVIGSTLTHLLFFSGNVPLLHMSRYVIACGSVLPGLARVIISTASEKR